MFSRWALESISGFRRGLELASAFSEDWGHAAICRLQNSKPFTRFSSRRTGKREARCQSFALAMDKSGEFRLALITCNWRDFAPRAWRSQEKCAGEGIYLRP